MFYPFSLSTLPPGCPQVITELLPIYQLAFLPCLQLCLTQKIMLGGQSHLDFWGQTAPIYVIGMMILSRGGERLKEKKIWVVCLEQTRPTVSVLASNCGCNKLLRTYWLKTTAICYLIVLEHRSPKIKVSAGLGSFWRLHRKIRFLICTGIWRPPAVLGFFLLLLGPRFCHHISFLDSDPPVSLLQRPGDGIEGPLK